MPLLGARILLAEDNEINQQIATELLEGAGATVKVANNGREATELLSGGPQPPPFDVVLMDLQMPEMDGFQATAKLRNDVTFRHPADHRNDRARDDRGTPALPRRRHERPRCQTNRSRTTCSRRSVDSTSRGQPPHLPIRARALPRLSQLTICRRLRASTRRTGCRVSAATACST